MQYAIGMACCCQALAGDSYSIQRYNIYRSELKTKIMMTTNDMRTIQFGNFSYEETLALIQQGKEDIERSEMFSNNPFTTTLSSP